MKSTSWHRFFFQCLSYYTIINVSHGEPLMGQTVRDANPGEFPFVVSIGKMRAANIEDRQFCTGTLVSPDKVLTCAHCLFRESVRTTEIIVGSTNLPEGKRYMAKTWKSYDMWKYNLTGILPSLNDVAIITLTKSVDLPNVTPAKIQQSTPRCSTKIKIAGWGALESGVSTPVLRTADFKITSNEECESSIGTVGDEKFVVKENFFCSFADPFVLSTCGDSGAPVMNAKKELVGLNIGACPELEKFNVPQESFPNERKRNLHLHLTEEYIKFINSLIAV